ncbi:hypothetical protein ACH4Q6_06230 [Streptomyces lydicus]|uniref:hypothetical protein n=1 Tax=Streptomyces lydicus TaxID=47763 RepID=UPI0037AA5BD2
MADKVAYEADGAPDIQSREPIATTPVQETLMPSAAGFLTLMHAHGIVTQPFTIPGVTRNHAVMVSLTEIHPDGQPFIGDAVMKVCNVAAHDGGVDVRAEISWDSDLPVRVSFLVS